ncbi:pyridoxamine 5'-phosphate oxidase family protein [Streptomyces anulatus]|uniref:pyridoxamine 5'-phosphate oxidase family protein n=1 Tax=Streptomyces anulatus TaxID=1892 RepID=UPI000689CC6C|nr:pyridoxamine 5'-phosphate oxidase family protein [Streptomyces anulatus]
MNDVLSLTGDLARRRCMELLRDGGYGRVAVTERALPVIVPVNYCLTASDEVVIGAGSRAGLTQTAGDTVVCFEAGGQDTTAGHAWSVTVTGYARPLTDGQRLRVVSARWLPQPDEPLLRLATTEVTGRVFPLLDRSADGQADPLPWPGGAPAPPSLPAAPI